GPPRSRHAGGFLVLPGVPGSDQDIYEAGQKIERAEVISEPNVDIPNSLVHERGIFRANASPRVQEALEHSVTSWIPPTTTAVQADVRSLSRPLSACEFGMTNTLGLWLNADA